MKNTKFSYGVPRIGFHDAAFERLPFLRDLGQVMWARCSAGGALNRLWRIGLIDSRRPVVRCWTVVPAHAVGIGPVARFISAVGPAQLGLRHVRVRRPVHSCGSGNGAGGLLQTSPNHGQSLGCIHARKLTPPEGDKSFHSN